MKEIVLNEKKIKTLMMLFLLITAVVIFTIPTASAFDNPAWKWQEEMNFGVWDIVNDTFFGGNYYQAIMNNNIAAIIGNSVKGVGIVFCLVFFVVQAVHNMDRGTDQIDAILKAIISFSIAWVVIINCDLIFDALQGLGEGISNVIQGSLSRTDAPKIDIIKNETTANIFEILGDCLTMILPYFGMKICEIAMKLAMYSILMEIIVRRAFAPMAIADVCGEGLRSPGVRYMKRFLACYLKVALCMVIAFLGSTLLGVANHDTDTNFAIEILAIDFTIAGMMFKTSELANDIVGA